MGLVYLGRAMSLAMWEEVGHMFRQGKLAPGLDVL